MYGRDGYGVRGVLCGRVRSDGEGVLSDRGVDKRERYTRGAPVIHAPRVSGLRPLRYTNLCGWVIIKNRKKRGGDMERVVGGGTFAYRGGGWVRILREESVDWEIVRRKMEWLN